MKLLLYRTSLNVFNYARLSSNFAVDLILPEAFCKMEVYKSQIRSY